MIYSRCEERNRENSIKINLEVFDKKLKKCMTGEPSNFENFVIKTELHFYTEKLTNLISLVNKTLK